MRQHDNVGAAWKTALVAVVGWACTLPAGGQGLNTPEVIGQPNINLRWGQAYATYGLGAQARLTYTDNVDLEEDNPKSDFLLDIGPTLSGEMGWGGGVGPELRLPGGEEFRIRLNLKYSLRYSFRDGVVQAYGAPISAEALIPIYIRYLGWTVALSDTFDHTRRTLDTTFGFGQQDISVYNNTATLSAYRSFGRTTLTTGASRRDQIVIDAAFADQEFTYYSFFFTPSYALNEAMSVFWSNSYNITDIGAATSRDSKGWSSSVGISGLITRNISGSVSIGYSRNTLEAGVANGIPVGEETFEGINSGINLNYANPLRPYTTHSVAFFHSLNVPTGLVGSSITEAYGASYTISHLLNRWVTLSPRVSWTRQSSLGTSTLSETVDIIHLGIGLDRRFTGHLSGGVSYTYQVRDSNIDDQSYDVNQVTGYLQYNF